MEKDLDCPQKNSPSSCHANAIMSHCDYSPGISSQNITKSSAANSWYFLYRSQHLSCKNALRATSLETAGKKWGLKQEATNITPTSTGKNEASLRDTVPLISSAMKSWNGKRNYQIVSQY